MIKILAKLTGLGNRIQFIPVIQNIQKSHIVTSDSNTFRALGVIVGEHYGSISAYIMPIGYDWIKVLRFRLKHPRAKLYGFKYRIRGRHFGFLYTKSIKFDETKHEIYNNFKLYKMIAKQKIFPYISTYDYSLLYTRPIYKNRIVLAPSGKKNKDPGDKFWNELLRKLVKRGYDVKVVDHDIGVKYHITPNLGGLYDLIGSSGFFIGVDSGVMHLADILGVHGLVMFGPTSIIKNQPVNNLQTIDMEFECAPCYNYGRINCTFYPKYECMNFSVENILTKLEIWENQ